jgi:hypothetical protein
LVSDEKRGSKESDCMGLAVESKQVFDVMEVAYRKGVTDKVMPLLGQAMKRVKDETGVGMAELSNSMNDVDDRTVERLDRVLKYSGPLLRLAANETLMGLTSRILDLGVVKRTMVWGVSMSMKRTIDRRQGKLTPPGESLKSVLGREG